MRYVLLIICIALLASSGISQEQSTRIETPFIEYNFGFAYTEDFSIPFPGTSFLVGKTIYNEETKIITEMEIGVALPTIITGKIGIGKKFNENTIITAGVRPWPLHLYIQPKFKDRKKGYWIMSLEISPVPNTEASFYSTAILNFGYRWDLSKRKSE